MPDKRPPPDEAALQNGTKKARSNDGSSAPPASQTNGGRGLPSNIQGQIAKAKEKAEEMRRQRESMGKTSSPAPTLEERVAAIRAKVKQATSNVRTSEQHQTSSPALQSPRPLSEMNDESSKRRGGLGVGLHPALTGESQDTKAKSKPATGNNQRHDLQSQGQEKKQLDLSGPSLEELKQNPYFDINISGGASAPRARKARPIVFHEQGKFQAQAAALRKQARLEEMKRNIAQATRRAGLDEDRSELALLIPDPPNVEWWDEGLLVGDAYPDFDEDAMVAEKAIKIDTEDTIITRYVQHPVLLVPPQEKKLIVQKPMFMTKEEQAKKRRHDRMEELKEKQAKVRLGLAPPDPPKIKKSNLMRVLGEEAVKDPTAVEARVNREIAERRETHIENNAERALTKEQRAEKIAANQEKDAAKGVHVTVYKIDSLAYGKHRYQMDMNAKQRGLTGIVILHPKLNLVIVEGGAHSINKYRKLMLQRINWTENAPTTAAAEERANDPKNKDATMEAQWLKPEDEQGNLKDLSENRCVLVWEGEEKERSFKTWRSRVCESDSQAWQALERTKMQNMWQFAKNMSE